MTKANPSYDVLEFTGREYVFSNFAFGEMIVPRLGNKKFYYLENAYQAGKSDDPAVWERFTDPLMTPGVAKREGQLLKIVHENWDAQPSPYKVEWMYELLQIKFQAAIWRRRLLGTFQGQLVEGNTWHDNFWGDCRCLKCKNIVGQNHLGKLLMRLRKSYIS